MLWGILTAYISGLTLVWADAQEFLQSEEFLLPFAMMAMILGSISAGWILRSISAGHREAKLRRLFGDGKHMTKFARRRRQEDQLYEAITSLVYKGEMSRREAKRLFHVLATKGGYEGLLIPPNEYKKLHAYQMARLKAKTERELEALANSPAPALPADRESAPKEEPKAQTNIRSIVTRVKTRWAA